MNEVTCYLTILFLYKDETYEKKLINTIMIRSIKYKYITTDKWMKYIKFKWSSYIKN